MIGKTLLVGSCGYIGSRLYQFLQTLDVAVTTIDLEWFGNFVNPDNWRCDYADLDKPSLASFANVILLAGHSNARMCRDTKSAFKNNVANFVNLLEFLGDQRLIYASSASVYGRTNGREAAEDDLQFEPQCSYDLTKFEIDCYARLSRLDYYGLRFGTVCGFSPNLRSDLILNQMYLSARDRHVVEVVGPATRRAVLGIEDLCRAVWAILCGDSRPGIYNVASLNLSTIEAGQAVSQHMGAELVVSTDSENLSPYDFRIDTRKFEDAFDFQFLDTVPSIVDSLHETPSHQSNRVSHAYA